MKTTYAGSCHCGAVRFELDAELRSLTECNCSLCRRVGALWHGASDQHLRIVAGEPSLREYRFHTRTAAHYFCATCGAHPFSRPRLDPTRWAVNARCLEGVDLAALPVRAFDGKHWEDAARQWRADSTAAQKAAPLRIAATVSSAPGRHRASVRTGAAEHAIAVAPKGDAGGSATNGGELLMLALATCYCNDLYREAARLGMTIDEVQVEASADFAGVGLAASNVRYRASVQSPAPAEAIERLLRQTDAVAEVHNTLRRGVPVRWDDTPMTEPAGALTSPTARGS